MLSLIDRSTEFFEKNLFTCVKKDLSPKDEKLLQVDSLCFKTALKRFLRTGTKENAYDVFFCYVEVFKMFGGYGEDTDTLLNLLYDHEVSAATLLKKHRDHYSHSAYIFAIGLALYYKFPQIREAFKTQCLQKEGEPNICDAHDFLKTWGLASLFHDVGYPFEITFQNLVEYQANLFGDKDNSLVQASYANIDGLVSLSEEEISRLGEYGDKKVKNINDVLSIALSSIWKDENGKYIEVPAQVLKDHIEKGTQNTHNAEGKPKTKMDHAYFSAVIILKKLLRTEDFVLDKPTMDAIVAILLHASFFRYNLRGNLLSADTKLSYKSTPLAFLLSMCDEIQCWDRVPYGKASRDKAYPWDMDLDFLSDGEGELKELKLTYSFEPYVDKEYLFKYSQDIRADIERFCLVDELLSDYCVLNIISQLKIKDKRINASFSETRYVDCLEFALAINWSYLPPEKKEICFRLTPQTWFSDEVWGMMTDEGKERYRKDWANLGPNDLQYKQAVRIAFDSLSLEKKLSNIQQTKYYAIHLKSIGCFFSSKYYDFKKVTRFTPAEKKLLSCNEHIRWVHEQVEMGWRYGIRKESAQVETGIYDYCDDDRDLKRLHKDIVPFGALDDDERMKDIKPMENIIYNLSKISNLSVYRIPTPRLKRIVGCVGHRNMRRIYGWPDNEGNIRQLLRKTFRKLLETYELTLISGFAGGADLIIVEEAINCGIAVEGVLSKDWQELWKEHPERDRFAQLFAQVSDYTVRPNDVRAFSDVRQYIVDGCDILIAMWDEDDPYENGINIRNTDGDPLSSYNTYLSVESARQFGKEVIIIPSNKKYNSR